MPNYQNIFFAHNGPGPYVCFFCGDAVTMDEVRVHHVDGRGRTHESPNHDASNLVPSHEACHVRHHRPHEACTFTDEHRRKLSDAAKLMWATRTQSEKDSIAAAVSSACKGRTLSDEQRQRISESQRGRPKSVEHRQRIAEGQRRAHAARKASLEQQRNEALEAVP